MVVVGLILFKPFGTRNYSYYSKEEGGELTT